MSDRFVSEMSEYEEVEEHEIIGPIHIVHENGIKFLFRKETSSHHNSSYDPPPVQFARIMENARFLSMVPTILQLFELFWPYKVFLIL